MVEHANKALSQRILEEIWNGGNLDLLGEVTYPQIGLHDPDDPSVDAGLEVARQLLTTYRTAFPDLRFTIQNQIAEGDFVATRWTATGTHQGPIRSIPPTGRTVNVTGTTMERYTDGKLYQSWISWDGLGLMQQLDVIPPFESIKVPQPS